MSNEAKIDGSKNIVVQDVAAGASVTVNNVLDKSYEYNDLLDQLKKAEKYFSRLLEDETEERLETSAEINRLKERIEQFKADVLKLAQTFERIEINTERLKRAREFFDKGEIGEARAVLESELEQMRDEQEQLLDRRQEFEEEILPKLRNNAEEFLMLALLTVTDYQNKNRHREVRDSFERSIKSLETKDNLFQFAGYLLVTNEAAEAERLYERLQKKFGDELSVAETIAVNINLGNLYIQQNEFANAESSLSKAIELLNTEESAPFPDHKSNLAAAYMNLGVSYANQLKYEEAKEVYEKAVEIYEELKEEKLIEIGANLIMLHSNFGMILFLQRDFQKSGDHYQKAFGIIVEASEKYDLTFLVPTVKTFMSMGILHSFVSQFESAKQAFEGALDVIAGAGEDTLQMLLPDKAMVLTSFGDSWARQGNYADAQKLNEEAFAIMTEFMSEAPEFYSVQYSIILANLSECYCKNKVNREESVKYAVEAIGILDPLLATRADLGEFSQKAANTLKEWEAQE